MPEVLVFFLLSYLIGSIPFSFLIAKARGVDLRTVGSGNTGASNVWRLLGFRTFVPALLLDMLKGTLPTWLAYEVGQVGPNATILVGLCAVLGHMFPLFLGFRGGKAVATATGVLLALQPWLVVIASVTWIVFYRLKGYPSLSSLMGGLAAVIAATLWTTLGTLPLQFALYVWVAFAVVVYNHRTNIQRLLHGQEMGIGPRTK